MNEIRELIWTTRAINGGGELSVKQSLPNKSIFRATMRWPNEVPVAGSASTSLTGALENLEIALEQDAQEAADE